tara:strand:+ start:458 stop:955 length:498 start_codon:yes stop_codon:yes gene_type:complete
MAEDYTTFTTIVNGSETLSERFSALVQDTINTARETYSVNISPEDCLALTELRNATLGATLDADELARQIAELPALSDSRLRAEIAAGNEEARQIGLQKVAGSGDVHPDRQNDDRARRISKARDLGIATPPPVADDTLSREEKLRMIDGVSPAQKIALARKWGLL